MVGILTDNPFLHQNFLGQPGAPRDLHKLYQKYVWLSYSCLMLPTLTTTASRLYCLQRYSPLSLWQPSLKQITSQWHPSLTQISSMRWVLVCMPASHWSQRLQLYQSQGLPWPLPLHLPPPLQLVPLPLPLSLPLLLLKVCLLTNQHHQVQVSSWKYDVMW